MRIILENILKEHLKDVINGNFLRAIISNPKSKDGISKIKIRPVMLNGDIMYQATEYVGTQVFHHNYSASEIVEYMFKMISNSFKQCEILTNDIRSNILVSKKGKVTINKKKSSAALILPSGANDSLNHNRKKRYILEEGIAVPFLVDLGVMNKQGDVLKPRYDKFKQINRFLEFVRDIVDELPQNREINIIDFGCGKSYLTFAIYYYLHELCGFDVRITGLDLKKDVIDKCNQLSEKYGYDKLIFKLGDIAEYQGEKQVDMVVTLHACDTATDYALYKAVSWNSKVILSVPCCQHEVNKQISNEILAPVLDYGILKDRMSAIITDAVRAESLRIKGYKTEILEFIDMEHTPKNLLIRAVKSNETGNRESLIAMIRELNIEPSIVSLLEIGMEECVNEKCC
jgi:SAM-dependent methyltransferase